MRYGHSWFFVVSAPDDFLLCLNGLDDGSSGVPMGILSIRFGWVVLLWGLVALRELWRWHWLDSGSG
jgi:hypothetical protein